MKLLLFIVLIVGLAYSKEAENAVGCEICEYVVGYVEKFLGDGKTEKEIEQALESICKLLPGSMQDTCNQIVEQYLPAIIQFIEQELPAKKICEMIGLCSKEEQSNDVECTLCTKIIDYVEKFLAEGKTEKEIESALESICKLFPKSIETTCDQLVEQYLPTIIQYVEQSFPADKICQMIGFCSKEEESNNVECTLCTKIIDYVEKFLAEGKTEKEIESALESICKLFPKSIETTCNQIVEQYLPTIIQYIEQSFPADKICQMIGFCSKSEADGGEFCSVCEYVVNFVEHWLANNHTEEEIEQFIEKACALIPFTEQCNAIVEEYLPVMIEMLEKKFPPQKVCEMLGLCTSEEEVFEVDEPTEGGLCSVCEYVVNYVEHWLANNHTEEEIEKFIEKACALIPFTSECNQIVEEYLPVIIDMLEKKFPPQKVCELLGLCSSDEEEEEEEEENLDVCQLCMYVVGYVEKWLAENKTEVEIETLIEKACALIPYTSECKELVEEYLPMIIQFLEAELPAKKVCQMIDLCPQMERTEMVKADMCATCKYVVNLVDTFLNESKTEEEIKELLEKYCNLLPKTYYDECKQMVEQYLPLIITFLEDHTPDQICMLLDLCPRSSSEDMDMCDLCTWAATIAEKWLNNNKTEEQVMEGLNHLCDLLPAQEKSECKLLVDEYVPTIIDYIEQELPPKTICQMIGLCHKETRTIRRPMNSRIIRVN